MRPRLALALLLVSTLGGDTQADLMSLFAKMAEALSDSNAPRFLSAFDPSTPGLDKLSNEVRDLVDDAEVSSSVEMISDQGNEQKHTVELDWYLEIKGKSFGASSEQRRQVVRCRLGRRGKQWKIVSLEPIAFFAPPKL